MVINSKSGVGDPNILVLDTVNTNISHLNHNNAVQNKYIYMY